MAATSQLPRRVVRTVLAAALLTAALLGASATPAAARTAFDGTGMWIWQLPKSSGGSPAAIASVARRYNVRSVYVKSSDGEFFWRQFTPAMISSLKSYGLKVCAWQYVYGDLPTTEAILGARAVQMGADCLVIDAESEYEGRYASADTYIRELRARIGSGYPLGLAPFPYVDYHPSFPYSVFLGPNGAQYNLPQMYWKTIGTSVDNVYAHTYTYNRVYNRRIYPLGQTYQSPSTPSLVRFRQQAVVYGAKGVNWWDWQETTTRAFRAVGQRLPALRVKPRAGFPVLGSRSRGDLVVWVQQHLLSAGYLLTVDGRFGGATAQAVRGFQASRGIPATGVIADNTWKALLRLAPTALRWGAGGARRASTTRALNSGARAPWSARLRPLGREIPPKRHGRG